MIVCRHQFQFYYLAEGVEFAGEEVAGPLLRLHLLPRPGLLLGGFVISGRAAGGCLVVVWLVGRD